MGEGACWLRSWALCLGLTHSQQSGGLRLIVQLVCITPSCRKERQQSSLLGVMGLQLNNTHCLEQGGHGRNSREIVNRNRNRENSKGAHGKMANARRRQTKTVEKEEGKQAGRDRALQKQRPHMLPVWWLLPWGWGVVGPCCNILISTTLLI